MSLLHLYSPSLCPVCETEIESPGLCSSCRDQLQRLNGAGRCATCFSMLDDRLECPFCSTRHVFFNTYRALYALDEKSAPLVHKLKFENERWLIRMFTDAVCDLISSMQVQRIGYISSGKLAHRTRPYQPLADLVKSVSAKTGISGGSDIMKIRRAKQSMARYENRFFDIPLSLRLTASFEKVDYYLLLEDIFTTGATANESARLLKRAGVKEVHVISLFQRQRDGLVWTPSQEAEREKLISSL